MFGCSGSLPGLNKALGGSDFLQIPQGGLGRIRQLLSGGSVKFEKGPAKVGEDVNYFGPGGGRRPNLQHVLQCCCLGNNIVQIRDLSDYPPDRADHFRIPPQDGLSFVVDATTAR